MSGLSELENQFALAWANGHEMKCSNSVIREKRRLVAFHEAAHVVASAFNGGRLTRIVHATIIPDEKKLGHVRLIDDGSDDLSVQPFPSNVLLGRRMLLYLLAGSAAEMRHGGDLAPEEILDPDRDLIDFDEESDTARAIWIAKTISYRYMPPMRILAIAERWTKEFIARKDVWKAIENVAGCLLRMGTIHDRNQLEELCLGAVDGSHKDLLWRNRLHEVPRRLASKIISKPQMLQS